MQQGEVLARKEKKLLGSKGKFPGNHSVLPLKQLGEVPGKEEENSSQARSVRRKRPRAGAWAPRCQHLRPLCLWGLFGFKRSPQSSARLREKRVLSLNAVCPKPLPFPIFPTRLTRGLPNPGGAGGAVFRDGPPALTGNQLQPGRVPLPLSSSGNVPPASVPLPGACGAAAPAGGHPHGVPSGMSPWGRTASGLIYLFPSFFVC